MGGCFYAFRPLPKGLIRKLLLTPLGVWHPCWMMDMVLSRDFHTVRWRSFLSILNVHSLFRLFLNSLIFLRSHWLISVNGDKLLEQDYPHHSSSLLQRQRHRDLVYQRKSFEGMEIYCTKWLLFIVFSRLFLDASTGFFQGF